MNEVSKESKMSADGPILEMSEVNARRRVTRSTGDTSRSVQANRSLRKDNITTDKKTDKHIKDDKIEAKNSTKDPVNRATQLKQIFQQPCVLANKLDDFSSGCTPFRKIVEKRSKRKQTEAAPRPAKKARLGKLEQKARQGKHLESDGGVSADVRATSDVCDDESASNVAVKPVKSCVYSECSGSRELVVDLSGFKYPGRKRMMCESAGSSYSDTETLPERSQVHKKTSHEERTDCEKLREATGRDEASLTLRERIESMRREDSVNVETAEGVDGTAGDEELAAIMQRREDEKITEERLTESKFIFCDVCQKQLNHLSVQRRHLHVNICTERREKEEARRQREAAKTNKPTSHTLGCPICGVPLKTAASRTAHLKKCAAKYKISTSDLMNLVREQENDPTEHARILNQNQSALTGAANKRRIRNRRLDQPKSLDEGLQLAVALSTSLQEEQERQARVECIVSESTDAVVSVEKPTIPDAFKVLMSPRKSKVAKRDRRKPTKAPSILTHSADETKRRLMSRVASLIIPQTEADHLTTTTGHWQCRETQLGATYTIVCSTSTANDPSVKVTPLWERGSRERDAQTDTSLYYVSQLMPPVHPCLSSAGAKLKRMSCIPGYATATATHDNKRISLPSGTAETSSLDQSAVQTSTCLPVTQTAAVLSALAEEAGQSQLSHDGSVIDGDTGDISHHLQPAGYCQQQQEPRVDRATETLLGALAKMVNNPTLSDVTLTVQQGRDLHAHKFMLVARCPRLLELFERDALSWLSDYKEEAMMAVLRFIYVGDVFVPPSAVQQTRVLAERLNLEDLASVCREIIESHRETLFSEMAAIRGDNKAPVDLDLQHMLKDIWGSDSEESENSSDGEKDTAKEEEEEMEELYEYMSTQRQKLKERHHHGNGNNGTDDDRKTTDVTMETVEQQSPLLCEITDVDVTLTPSMVGHVTLEKGECSENLQSPHRGINTPRSILTRSLSPHHSDLDRPRSDSETSLVEGETPGLNTPKSDMSTPRVDICTPRVDMSTPRVDMSTPRVDMSTPSVDMSTPSVDMSTPRVDSGSVKTSRNAPVVSGSESPLLKQRKSVTASTTSSTRKDLFRSTQSSSPNTHSHSQTLAEGDSTEASTADLNRSCVSPDAKSNEVTLCEDRDGGHLSSPGDVTLLCVTKRHETTGDKDRILHESPTETSTFETSDLDLFESFLADRSVEQPPSPPGGSTVHSGSTAATQNPEAESVGVQEDEIDSIGVLEYHEDLDHSDGMLEDRDKQDDSVMILERDDSSIAPDEGTVSSEMSDGAGRQSDDENDVIEAIDRRENQTNPTALLVRLSSLLSENSSEDAATVTPPANSLPDDPWTSPTISGHGDGPLIVHVHRDSLRSSFSGSPTCSVTPEREVLSSQPKRRTDKSSLVQQYNVDVTSCRASVGPLRTPPSVRRLAKLSRRRCTRGESSAIVRDETSTYDTVDLTQDDACESPTAAVTPPGGNSSHHTEDVMCSPSLSDTDGVLAMMSPQGLTQQTPRSERRGRTPRRSRGSAQEKISVWRTGEVEDLTREQLEDLTGDMEEDHAGNILEDYAGELMKDLSDDLVDEPITDPVHDDPIEDFIHDPVEDLMHDVSVEITRSRDLGHDPPADPVEDLTGEEGDSYYDPPTFIGDEYSDIRDEPGRGSKEGRTPQRTFSQISLQGGPVSRQNPITPRPNLTAMETPQLKAACHKIGVKAMPKKRMVKLLNHVYEETHGLSPDECLPVIQKKATKSEAAAAKRGQKKNLASDTAKTNCRKRVTSAASREDPVSDGIEDIMVDTRMSPSSSPLKGVSHKRQQIRDFILSHEDIYLKMLHYEPLESEEFRQQLKDSGLNIGASVIMDFLDEQNIALTTRQTSGWRHKGKKQKTKKRKP